MRQLKKASLKKGEIVDLNNDGMKKLKGVHYLFKSRLLCFTTDEWGWRRGRSKGLFRISLLIFFLGSITCLKGQENNSFESRSFSERELYNLTVLSKSYGYIRYFYPNHHLVDFDWDIFLYYAQDNIIDSNSDEKLIQNLEKVFKPICAEVYFSKVSASNHKRLKQSKSQIRKNRL